MNYSYFISGEEKRKDNNQSTIWLYLFSISYVVMIETLIILHNFIDLPPYLSLSISSFTLIFVVIINLFRVKNVYMKKWNYYYDIKIDKHLLSYSLESPKEKLKGCFTIYKTKRTKYGIRYYENFYSYIFVPNRVLEHQ